jgi:hypothetical protein
MTAPCTCGYRDHNQDIKKAAHNLIKVNKVVEYTFGMAVELLHKLNSCTNATYYKKKCFKIISKLSKQKSVVFKPHKQYWIF